MNNNRAGSRIAELWGETESRLAKQPAWTEASRPGTDPQRLQHELAEHAQRIRELSHHLIAAQEEERQRLAAELHDSTSPNLSAVALNLGMLAADLAPTGSADIDSRFADTQALLADAMASIRDTCAGLRPAMLEYAGLARALQGHVELFSRRTGIVVEFSCRDLDRRLTTDLETCLFRIAQEALTNAAKHAQASAVRIELVYAAEHTVLIVSDNGVGFDPSMLGQSEHRPGLGLLTVRERVEAAGGKFNLESEPGKGTRISVEIGTRKSRVVLANDHKLFRKAMRMVLERDPSIEVVGEAGDGTEALDMLRSVHPDVVVLDVRMPNLSGVGGLQQLVAADSSVRVIVLSVTSEPRFVSAMLGAGARGYVTKGDAGELPRAICAVVSGTRYLSTEVATTDAGNSPFARV